MASIIDQRIVHFKGVLNVIRSIAAKWENFEELGKGLSFPKSNLSRKDIDFSDKILRLSDSVEIDIDQLEADCKNLLENGNTTDAKERELLSVLADIDDFEHFVYTSNRVREITARQF